MLGTQQLSGMLGDILGLGQIPYPDRHSFFVFHFWGVEEYLAFFLRGGTLKKGTLSSM